jgi:hypothetical protein
MVIQRCHTKRVLSSTAATLLCFVLGCSLPVIPADDTYEVLGGIVQREHPSLGRANSAFDLVESERASEAKLTPSVSAIPSIFNEPQPLERLKHSPIIP